MSKETATAILQAIPQTPAPATTQAPGGEPGLQPTDSKPAEPAKEIMDSTRWAQLSKKEQALQKDREAFKAQQETHKQEMAKMQEIHKKLQEFETLKVKDPVAALKLAGFSETDLFNFIAQAEDKSTPEEKAARAAQAEIKKFQDEQAKKEQEANLQAQTKALEAFKSDISKTVTQDKDKYEYCNFHGPLAEELILETVSQVLQDSGEIISPKEAADMVEEYYEETDKKMMSLKKRQPKQEAPKVDSKPQEAPVKPASKTLSSRTSATIASTTIPRQETKAEKRERLMSKLVNLGK